MKKLFAVAIGVSMLGFAACENLGHDLGGRDEASKLNVNDGADSGGGTGGAVGTGGTAATPSVPPPPPPPPSNTGSQPCEDLEAYRDGYWWPGCRLENGECGVNTDFAHDLAISTDGMHRMPGGCQAFNQVGRTSLECPDMGTIAGNFRGCCRPDNTCGYNFSSVVDGDGLFKGAGTLPLGCVPQYVTTAPPDGDAGGLPRPRLPSDPCTWVPDEVDGG